MSVCAGSVPVVTVSYGPIKAVSNVQELVSAWNYLQMSTIDFSVHVSYFEPLFCANDTPIVEWSDFATEAQTCGTRVFSSRNSRNTRTATSMYTNPGMFLSADSNDYTGPFGIFAGKENSIYTNPTVNVDRKTYFWSISQKNYLTNASYPAWKAVGTSKMGAANMIAEMIFPGNGRDEFETRMFPMGQLPDADFSYFDSITGVFPNQPRPPNSNANYHRSRQELVFVGMINTNYTGGERIGYIRFSSALVFDVFGFMGFSDLAPNGTDPESPRYRREALTKAYSTFMEYLVTDLEVDNIIIDIRGNLGGITTSLVSLRELFGENDEVLYESYFKSFLDITNNAPGVDLRTFQYDNNAAELGEQAVTAYPSISREKYPNAVFTGGRCVILTDANAASAGDIFPNLFLGSSFDKELGGNTSVSLSGEISGKNYGSSSFNSLLRPMGAVSRSGAGLSPLVVNGDGPSFNARVDGSSFVNSHPALAVSETTLSGLSGSKAMPSDWETLVYPDFGFVPHPRPRLSGDSRPQPLVLTLTNPFQTFAGSNVVRVNTVTAHGFSVGDNVAFNDVHRPVADVAGFTSFNLGGGHIVTAVTATTFDVEIGGSELATASMTGVGGDIRVMNRNHWRDSWLEATVEEILSTPTPAKKKRRAKKAPSHRSTPKKFDPRSVEGKYKRDVICPEGMTLTDPRTMNATIYFNIPPYKADTPLIIAGVVKAFGAVIEEELNTGGMCLTSEGHIMATPTCKNMPGITRHERKESAFGSLPNLGERK